MQAFDTQARAAFVYDVTTRTILMEKDADVPIPPASMSKLMTLNMLFEALHDGRVTMETQFGVSSRAKNMGGSTMFLNENDRPTVEELIQGIIVLSGNDACVVVAEGLAGSEDAFARLMNDRAAALGMTGSTFANASGWPNPNHRMSVHDLGMLAVRLITEFPEYYGYFGQTEYRYDDRAPDNRFNRNPLLHLGIGADGLKTGHTSEAGYGIVGSATQGTRRIVFVISGLTSEKERAEESERIVNWAFRQFVQKNGDQEGRGGRPRRCLDGRPPGNRPRHRGRRIAFAACAGARGAVGRDRLSRSDRGADHDRTGSRRSRGNAEGSAARPRAVWCLTAM